MTNIGMKKMAYIGHRNEAQPSSCGQYRPFFEFLYLSQGREKNPISYIVVFFFQKKNSPILRYRATFFALYYDIVSSLKHDVNLNP